MEKHEKAVELVKEFLKEKDHLFEKTNIKLVWYTKTLKNWKAMVADISDGGMFFEVTYNGDKQETYIDAYNKVANSVVKDR